MRNRIQEAFDHIHAEEELKRTTKAFLFQKTNGYAKRKAAPRKRMAAIAACLLFLLVGSGAGWAFFTPTATISIDVNPSVELRVNRFDKVVKVEGYNQDGRELAESLHISFIDYQKAIARLLESQRVAQLLSKDEILTIAVAGTDDGQRSRMLSHIEACTAGHTNAHCYATDAADVEAAHGLGLSHGKYKAFLELQALDPTVTPEEIQGMTMREIRDRIAAMLPGGVSDASGGHHTQGNGHGQGRGNGHGRKSGG